MSQAKTRENTSVVVGVTGGMGSGKSTVSKLLEEEGFTLIDSDALIREKVLTDSDVIQQVADKFGKSVLKTDGAIDRAALSKQVFSDPANLSWLEELTHPRLFELWRATMLAAMNTGIDRPVQPDMMVMTL